MTDKRESWDVLAAGEDGAVLWSAYNLCAKLAMANHRVRLFAQKMQDLSRNVPAIKPAAWVQDHAGFEVLAYPIADHALPAHNVVQVHASPIPERYRDLMSSGATQRRLLSLAPLSASVETVPLRNYIQSSSLTLHHIQQGDAPTGAGMVKDLRPVSTLRQKWQRDPRCREASLSILGINLRLPADVTIIYVAEATGGAWLNLIEALSRDARQYHIFVGTGSQRPAFKALAQRQDTNFRVTLLPEMMWDQLDEMVWLSSIVITGGEDIALRAARAGTPLVWINGSGKEVDVLTDWYTRHCDPVFARFIRVLFHAVAGGTHAEIRDSITWYHANLNEVRNLALDVVERVRATPDVVDVMTALGGNDFEELPRGEFAPTVPLDKMVRSHV